MKPYILLSGFGLFLSCLAFHILIWRLRHPRHHALSLLGIFFSPLIVFALALIVRPGFLSWIGSASIGLLHIALSLAYIQIYPASQAASPSLKILLLVKESMPVGMTENEIQTCFNPKELLEARIQDLVDSGLVRQTDDKLELSPCGYGLVLPFIVLRKLLGLQAGQG